MKKFAAGLLASIALAGTSFAGPLPTLLPQFTGPNQNLFDLLTNHAYGLYKVSESYKYFLPSSEDLANDNIYHSVNLAEKSSYGIGGSLSQYGDSFSYILRYFPSDIVHQGSSSYIPVKSIGQGIANYPIVFLGYPGNNPYLKFDYQHIYDAVSYSPASYLGYDFLPSYYDGGNVIYGYFRYDNTSVFDDPNPYDVQGFGSLTISRIAVPEPSTLSMLILPLAALFLAKRRYPRSRTDQSV